MQPHPKDPTNKKRKRITIRYPGASGDLKGRFNNYTVYNKLVLILGIEPDRNELVEISKYILTTLLNVPMSRDLKRVKSKLVETLEENREYLLPILHDAVCVDQIRFIYANCLKNSQKIFNRVRPNTPKTEPVPFDITSIQCLLNK